MCTFEREKPLVTRGSRGAKPCPSRACRKNTGVTVLLVGTAQPSAHAAARSLRHAGFDVLGAREGGRLAGRTRYCRKLFRIPPSSNTAEFRDELDNVCEQEGVEAVLPLADEIMAALIVGRRTDAAWALVGPSREEFESVCNKARLVETATRAGLAIPSSVLVGPGSRSAALPPFPAYIKIVSGAEDGRPAGRPVRVRGAEECETTVGGLVAAGLSVIVQEEVIGEQWRFHFARSSGRTAHIAARTRADYPWHIGQSTVSEFSATPPALEQVATKLLDSLGYEGVGSVQFILRDRTWYVHDVNLRLPASVGGTVASGLDMPRLAVEIALGRNRRPTGVRAESLRFVQLHGELAALRGTFVGVQTGRSAVTIAWGIVLAALLPHRMLEPLDVRDPFPTLAALAAARARPAAAFGHPAQSLARPSTGQ